MRHYEEKSFVERNNNLNTLTASLVHRVEEITLRWLYFPNGFTELTQIISET